jgi:hypothetical protein
LPGLTLSSIKLPRDPEPELTQRLKNCLIDLAEKGDSELLLPRFREECAKSNGHVADIRKRLMNLKSFSYVTTEDVLASDRDGLSGVTRKRTCKLENGERTRFYIFELTADNRVAWCHSVAD